ncbi:MAG TPA: 1,4-alpha-glucan branching enzyme, partial [Synergistales bacterium]|nr:1,4-alpha-glucan branching enzyme [Synergistales bacterium]
MHREIGKVRNDISLLSDLDIHLFKEGSHYELYDKLGSHFLEIREGVLGTYFALWAPNAEYVSVIGDFNGWSEEDHALSVRSDYSGIWEGFIPGILPGDLYKFHIRSRYHNYQVEKGDPFSFFWEVAPKTASIVWKLDYEWNDA